MNEVLRKAEIAKNISYQLASYNEEDRKKALLAVSNALMNNKAEILEANQKDVAQAKAKGVTDALIDRLQLSSTRIDSIAEAVKNVSGLTDQLGNVKSSTQRPNGLVIEEKIVPLGVVSVIYEARPNVTVDITSLALKTGNAVLLRGSSSTIASNKVLVQLMQDALADAGFPKEAVQLIESPDRELTKSLFTAKSFIDVLIPRGGKSLIDTVVKEAEVPVIETGAGNCHVYIDESADESLARKIIVDAKVQRPSVCNAAESILLHKNWAEKYLPGLIKDLQYHGVTIHGDQETMQYDEKIQEAEDLDWSTEYLSLDLAVKIVPDTAAAIAHIQTYGSKHSEAIVAESAEEVEKFFNEVDASTLYHNASTRFTDGFEFGFGAEVGISTQKLHVRGPMGLSALTTTKYLVHGKGQTKGNLPLSEKSAK